MNRVHGLELGGLDYARGGGLVTVVTQDAATGEVLMVAHADAEAFAHTAASGVMHYHSRRRGLWRKGATSGNEQRVVSLTADCDGDSVLARVGPLGPACHTGRVTCFGDAPGGDAAQSLDRVIHARAAEAAATAAPRSYTRRLLGDRNLRLKKPGEETTEFVVACADGDRERAIEEAADVVYHLLVALRALGAGWGDVLRALARRAREPVER